MLTGVESLRTKCTQILDRRERILSAAIKAGRGLTAEEKGIDNSLFAEARMLRDTIARADDLQRARFDTADRPRVEVRTPARPKGYTFAACLFSIAGAELLKRNGTEMMPAQFAENRLHDFHAAAALSGSALTAGGVLIREDISDDFLEGLYPRSVVRAAGARVDAMPQGNLTLNGIDSGPVTSWIGEQQVSRGTASTFLQRKLLAKKLRALYPISNDLVRGAGDRAVANILEDLKRAIAAAEDLAFLRGPGTAYTPAGLAQLAGKTAASAAAPTIKSVESETGAAIEALLDANARMISPAWVWAPRTSLALGSQRSPALAGSDSLGVKAWPEIERGLFRGFPFLDTTNIPTNLGAGNIDSEIYFADWADVVIGQGPIEVRRSGQALYTDNGGNPQSAFARDETLLDVIEFVDLGVRHPGSVYFLSAVEYVRGM
jgi:HK97 family phage major capsid protein